MCVYVRNVKGVIIGSLIICFHSHNIEAETHFEGKKFNSPRSENEVRHGREDSDPG